MPRDPLVAPQPKHLPVPSSSTTSATTADGRALIVHSDGVSLPFDEEFRCTVKRSDGSGQRCRKPAIKGHHVCAAHSGSAPQVRRAADRNLERERIDRDVRRLLAEREDRYRHKNPLGALRDALARYRAMVDVLAALMGDAPVHSERAQLIRVEYAAWLDRQTRAAKLAIDARLDERYANLAELHGMTLFRILTTAFNDPVVALTDQQKVDLEVALRNALETVETHQLADTGS